ncbi:hypothetical protein DSO57_1015900 [Entomophthora muscae]|uniref:Uncharacterized protein n=1 Tax=Entomophthora muscae TaxID=34485 RepID=A0ACC2S6U9_9FUNG|nr:hypothetical protein DSO57_1015900 [Entomophthora muscae]
MVHPFHHQYHLTLIHFHNPDLSALRLQISPVPLHILANMGALKKGLKWVKTSGRIIPEGAIQGGYESDNRPLYIARGYHKGCLVVGKAAGHLNGCMIPYGGEEITLKDYHVLVGDAEKVKWRECYDKLEINGWVPLEAGNEANGVELFIAKTFYKNSEVVGKVSENMRHGMTFGYAGVEIHAKKPMVYHVLSLA